MSIKIIDKKDKMINIEEESEVNNRFPDIAHLIIPFSIAFKKFTPPDIYNGEEMIPFNEKDVEFKQILIHEFLGD